MKKMTAQNLLDKLESLQRSHRTDINIALKDARIGMARQMAEMRESGHKPVDNAITVFLQKPTLKNAQELDSQIKNSKFRGRYGDLEQHVETIIRKGELLENLAKIAPKKKVNLFTGSKGKKRGYFLKRPKA
jgi:hypothetical protein